VYESVSTEKRSSGASRHFEEWQKRGRGRGDARYVPSSASIRIGGGVVIVAVLAAVSSEVLTNASRPKRWIPIVMGRTYGRLVEMELIDVVSNCLGFNERGRGEGLANVPKS